MPTGKLKEFRFWRKSIRSFGKGVVVGGWKPDAQVQSLNMEGGTGESGCAHTEKSKALHVSSSAFLQRLDACMCQS